MEDISIPRFSHIESTQKEVHIFTDASNDEIAAVAFLKVRKDDENCDVGFLKGNAKVANA